MANAVILALRHDRPPGEFIVLQILRNRDFPFVDLNAACKLHMQQTTEDVIWNGGEASPTIIKKPVYKAVWYVEVEFPEEAKDG